MTRKRLALLLPVLLASWLRGGEGHATLQETAQASICDPANPTILCLGPRHRFRIQVNRRTLKGVLVPGQPLPLTRQTGAWSFFRPGLPEVLVKVLDGRPVNGSFWVFYAGLTEAEYEIVVSDEITGHQRRYRSVRGQLASVADLTAFQDAGHATPPGATGAGESRKNNLFGEFQYLPITPVIGTPVQFTLTSPPDTSTFSICWEFELQGCREGEPCHVPPTGPCEATIRTPQHTYLTPGLRIVRVTLSDGKAATSNSRTLKISGCQYQVSLNGTSSFAPDGGSGEAVITAPPGCSWAAASDVDFITVDPPSGNGSGTVRFEVEPNPSSNSRRGNVIVAGHEIPVSQEADLKRACLADEHTLCLIDGRFEIRMNTGAFGPALVFPLSDAAGYFSFFDAANVELMTTAVDRTAQDRHFWLFFGGLTNVSYTITVRDRVKGIIKTYDNGEGGLASQKDTDSF
ncbi:MAG: PKD domain-containing protein [Acidobacteriota bacterium]|nr:PKD domain-containing protein [Acidobacteriota bacterium]